MTDTESLVRIVAGVVCLIVGVNWGWWFMTYKEPTLLNANLLWWPTLGMALAGALLLFSGLGAWG